MALFLEFLIFIIAILHVLNQWFDSPVMALKVGIQLKKETEEKNKDEDDELLLAATDLQLKALGSINRLMNLRNIQEKGSPIFTDPCKTFSFNRAPEARHQSCLREGRGHLRRNAVPLDETTSLNCLLP